MHEAERTNDWPTRRRANAFIWLVIGIFAAIAIILAVGIALRLWAMLYGVTAFCGATFAG